jgi:pimeloyl-ACP methyl ester carboxylesterase
MATLMKDTGIDGGPERERMLAGLGLSERRLHLGGTETAVLEAGDGPPLVLLHGGIECGGPYWAPVIGRLAADHRVIVPDMPGLGLSAGPARTDEPLFAAWLAALLGATCDQRPALVAHSLTGTLVMRFAAAHGDLLERLAIYASPGVGPYRIPLGLRAVAIPFSLRPTERGMRRFQRFALADSERTRDLDPDWFDAWAAFTLERARDRDVKRAMRAMLKSCAQAVPDERLRAIPVPASLIWAREDRMTPFALGADASDRLGWPLHAIDGAAHVPHIETPQAFLRALAAWEEAGA